MLKITTSRRWLTIQGFDAHAAHERRDVTPPNGETATTQHVKSADFLALVVNRTAGNAYEIRLTCKRRLARSIDHRFAPESPMRSSASAKTSIFNACWPISHVAMYNRDRLRELSRRRMPTRQAHRPRACGQQRRGPGHRDEVDAGASDIGIALPLGAALLGARVGDDVMRERPIGLLSLTVVAIDAGRISSSKAWKYR